jgi:hypothetical protein
MSRTCDTFTMIVASHDLLSDQTLALIGRYQEDRIDVKGTYLGNPTVPCVARVPSALTVLAPSTTLAPKRHGLQTGRMFRVCARQLMA